MVNGKLHTEGAPLNSQTVSIEEKTFYIEDRRNDRGEYVKLTETNRNHSRRNHLVVPRSGASQFAHAILAAIGEEPAKN